MAAFRNDARRRTTTAAVAPSLRHVWLASLGLLLAARRESQGAARRATTKAEGAFADARQAVKRAEAELRGGIEGVREQVQPRVLKFSRDVEARLAPVLDKLGLKTKHARATRKTRKAVAKMPALRRATRNPAKRVATQAAR